MARLVWDNVATPDFSPSMQGVRLFSDLIARAGQSATDTITGLDNRLADQQRMTLAQRMAGFQDADAYQAALASGSILDGLGRLKADDIMRADARLGTLIGREGDEARVDLTREQLRSETWNQDKKQDRYNAQRAAAPALAEIQAAGGDQAKIAEIRAKYAPQLAALDFTDSREVANDANSYITTAKGWRNSDQQYRISDYTQDRTEMTDRANDVGLQFASKYAGQSQAAMESDPAFQALDARGKVAAINALQAWKPADFGGVVSGLTGSDAGGSSDPYNTILGNGQFGAPPKPLTEMTLGEAINFGRNTLIPNTRNNAQLGLSNGRGSSAVGAYQFTQATLADFGSRVLGPNWANERMTPQVQDRLGRAIFESTRGDAAALKGRWQGLQKLSDARVAEIGRMPWEQARAEITKVEIGSAIPSPSQRQGVTDLATANRANLGNTSPSDPMMGAILEAGQSKESQTAVLARLTGDNGLFKGANRRDVDRALTDIMVAGNVNPAAAAVILEFSGREENVGDVVRRVASNWGPVPLLGRRVQRQVAGNLALGDGRVADYGRVLARVKMANDPTLLAGAIGERGAAETRAALAPQLNQQVTQWQGQKAAAIERQRATGVDQSREIARLDRLLQQAAQAYQGF